MAAFFAGMGWPGAVAFCFCAFLVCASVLITVCLVGVSVDRYIDRRLLARARREAAVKIMSQEVQH